VTYYIDLQTKYFVAKGRPLEGADLGQLFSRFFQITLSIHITITDMRKITETTIFQACGNGNVSQEDTVGVLNCEGHNKSTSNKFYNLCARRLDANAAMRAMDGVQQYLSEPDVLQHHYVNPPASSSSFRGGARPQDGNLACDKLWVGQHNAANEQDDHCFDDEQDALEFVSLFSDEHKTGGSAALSDEEDDNEASFNGDSWAKAQYRIEEQHRTEKVGGWSGSGAGYIDPGANGGSASSRAGPQSAASYDRRPGPDYGSGGGAARRASYDRRPEPDYGSGGGASSYTGGGASSYAGRRTASRYLNPHDPVPYHVGDLRAGHLKQHKKPLTPDWGSMHPNKDIKSDRTPYSKHELCYMNTFLQDRFARNPEINKLVVSKMLTYIKQDPSAYPIFHKNHVISNVQLRNGYRRLTIMAERVRAAEGLSNSEGNPLYGLTNEIINNYDTYFATN
jgi:hypothetical protein